MAEIIWTEPALSELDRIADYMALDDPEAASGVVRRVFEKVELLLSNPKLGNIPKELKHTPYRRLVVKPVYVYYRSEAGAIVVIFIDRSERDFDMSRITE